jgi:hypothetical protein
MQPLLVENDSVGEQSAPMASLRMMNDEIKPGDMIEISDYPDRRGTATRRCCRSRRLSRSGTDTPSGFKARYRADRVTG